MRGKSSGLWVWLVIVTIASAVFIASTDEPPPRDTLTEEQRRDVVARMHTEILNGELLYNLPQILPPAVEFFPELPQRNAALSRCNSVQVSRGRPTWSVMVNEKLAARNWDRYLSETIPHEAAHLILCQAGEQDWIEHGPRWETTVRDIGATPVAHHNY